MDGIWMDQGRSADQTDIAYTGNDLVAVHAIHVERGRLEVVIT
jgi:hypothetical protein